MAQYFLIHPSHPQPRLIAQAARIVREGGVILYPTDSSYAFGCHIGDKEAMERMRRMRGVDARHQLTLMCRDIAEVASFAKVDNARYKLLKSLTPGCYTFILEGTKELPRRLLHPKRKTIGVRIPDHPVTRALLAELGEPMLSATAILPGDDAPIEDCREVRHRLEHELALAMDGGSCGTTPTTVLDLTGASPLVLRQGKGPTDALAVN